jgi:hypothetical protein
MTINAGTWAAFAAIGITIAGGIVASAITWGQTSSSINVLNARANAADVKAGDHDRRLEAQEARVAVSTAKLDDILARLARVENTQDWTRKPQ